MDKQRSGNGHADDIRILDDLSAEFPVSAAELDAVEAFLMPLVLQILSQDDRKTSRQTG